MAEPGGGEKSLPASARKLEREREKGNVAKSQDLNSAITLFVALLALIFLGPETFRRLMSIMRLFFENAHAYIDGPLDSQALVYQILAQTAPIVLPLMLLLMAAGVVANIVQFGVLFSSQALMPKPERLNPIQGFQRFFSVRTIVELAKSIFKLSVISLIVYMTLSGRWNDVLSLMHLSPAASSLAVWQLIVAVWWRIALAMLALGILDYAFQRWQYGQDMRMTQQEARQEMKEMEGDPRIKQRVRQIQRQMAMQRMMADVPEADVIITNPITYAVALRYSATAMNVPIVVAKGARLQAQRIRELAVEHDVPIVERPELARALYRSVDIGQPIAEDLFKAVAEVLAYVYRIDRRTKKQEERKRQVSLAPA